MGVKRLREVVEEVTRDAGAAQARRRGLERERVEIEEVVGRMELAAEERRRIAQGFLDEAKERTGLAEEPREWGGVSEREVGEEVRRLTLRLQREASRWASKRREGR